ncbi:hypothetical protein PFNF135_01798 [Plasmodium falciparum NF135/5.C10]|uniref:Uncharacterized protein n=2 Tax=Plasmodium falciparum TaxID=5833 RepID=A0A024XBP4_PLAFC|nr:hypothetical protein PFNF135_01798 [Plasmodium falciparum NF135/5.C10]ETW62495.1 hypothetical protein PFMC_01687 [Plasmodium falciparum CAMP/Malaysia]
MEKIFGNLIFNELKIKFNNNNIQNFIKNLHLNNNKEISIPSTLFLIKCNAIANINIRKMIY